MAPAGLISLRPVSPGGARPRYIAVIPGAHAVTDGEAA
jgi:hypothetical protein